MSGWRPLKDEFRTMIQALAAQYAPPEITNVFLPPFQPGGQPKDASFMAICLADGSAGVSSVLLPDTAMAGYNRLGRQELIGHSPVEIALSFGSTDPVANMLSLAAMNALCRHVIATAGIELDWATDSLGLLAIGPADRVGMVGLFPPLLKRVKLQGAVLTVVELNEKMIAQYPDVHVTMDPSELAACNKVLCTSTTVLNHSLDDVLSHCSPEARVALIGPTAGYFPDALFRRGVDVVGGTLITDGPYFMELIASRKKWGPATRKFCFQQTSYTLQYTQ